MQALRADEVGKIADTGLAALAEACPGLQVKALLRLSTQHTLYTAVHLLALDPDS